MYKYRSIDLRRALASFSGRRVMTLFRLELTADTGPRWTPWPNPSCTIDMLSLIYYPTFNTLLVGDIISLSLGHMVGEISNGQSVTSQSRNSPGYLQKERDKESVSMSDPTGKTLLFLMNSRLFFLVLQSYSRIRAFIINVINDYR